MKKYRFKIEKLDHDRLNADVRYNKIPQYKWRRLGLRKAKNLLNVLIIHNRCEIFRCSVPDSANGAEHRNDVNIWQPELNALL